MSILLEPHLATVDVRLPKLLDPGFGMKREKSLRYNCSCTSKMKLGLFQIVARIPRPALSSGPPEGLDMRCGMQLGAYKRSRNPNLIKSNHVKILKSAGYAKQYWKQVASILLFSSLRRDSRCAAYQVSSWQKTCQLNRLLNWLSADNMIDKHMSRMDRISNSHSQLSFLVAPTCRKLASSSHDTVPLQTQSNSNENQFQGFKAWKEPLYVFEAVCKHPQAHHVTSIVQFMIISLSDAGTHNFSVLYSASGICQPIACSWMSNFTSQIQIVLRKNRIPI